MKKINERIRDLRTQFHLSQDYVANHLGINRASYCQLENGKRKVSADEVSILCTLFGVSADTILGENEVSEPIIAFARSFSNLDENDQAEILNLIRFKEQLKAQGIKK